MKPIMVRFGCFGPYRKEQTVDFSRLEKNGLFLICGETGSGKTTILDAICYALYGKSSGGLRGDMAVMRCKQAQEQEETFVEFVFQSGEHTYRFYRSMKPKKKRKADPEKKTLAAADFNITCECQRLEDGIFAPLADAKDKQSFLNSKAQELLGLTYEQFCQVIILPQGQFERLLVSNSEEKEQILVTLFHAQRWQRLAARLYELADGQDKALKLEKQLMERKLQEHFCDSIEELAEKAAQAGEKETLDAQAAKELETVAAAARQAYEAGAEEYRDFGELQRLEERLAGQTLREAHYRREAEALEKAGRAESLAEPRRSRKQAAEAFQEAAKALLQAQNTEKQSVNRLQEILREQARHQAGKKTHLENQAALAVLENAGELYAGLKRQEQEARLAHTALGEHQKKLSQAAQEFDRAEKAWSKAQEDQKRAIETYTKANELYLQGIGSTLAKTLREGIPCPVCGSIHHPAPAQPQGRTVTDGELDGYAREMTQAQRGEETLRHDRREAQQRLEAARTACENVSRQEAQARAAYQESISRLISGIANEQQRQTRMAELKAQIAAYQKAEDEMQGRVGTATNAAFAAGKELEGARTRQALRQAALDEAERVWREARQEAGFSTDEAYTAACMEGPEKQRREEALIRFRTELASAQKAVAEQRKKLEGRRMPDVAGLKRLWNEAVTAAEQARTRLVLAAQSRKNLDETLEQLRLKQNRYESQRVKAEEALVFARRLRGDYGVSLQRYVLGVMLGAITEAANELLKTVYGGRYQLFRTNEAAGSTRKRGLELEVYDSAYNARRSVTTLSGGEKFLVALSLAIGLSTVVQAQGRGVRLEAMFIDEGFGSLDRQSVGDALEVLQGIRRSSALVGIISHVEQLAETIPAKIQITKGKDGSTLSVCC